jgi:hypothetical protein
MPTLSATSPTLINPNNPITTTNPTERDRLLAAHAAAHAATNQAHDAFTAADKALAEANQRRPHVSTSAMAEAVERYHQAKKAWDAAHVHEGTCYDALRAHKTPRAQALYEVAAGAAEDLFAALVRAKEAWHDAATAERAAALAAYEAYLDAELAPAKPAFVLREFSVSTYWWSPLWGGGHTHETDPTNHGWRAKKIRNTGDPARGIPAQVLVGRAGVAGCFSAVLMSPREPGRAELDLAFYTEETPEQIAKAMLDKEPLDPIYEVVPEISGWGLVAIERLNALIAREKH